LQSISSEAISIAKDAILMRRLLGLAAAILALGLALFLPLPFAVITHVRNSVEIERPAAPVFAYVTTPGNWPRWHPSSRAVHGAVDHPLRLGESVTEDFLVAGRAGQVVWTVTEYESPRRWKIAGTIDGRPAGTVLYELREAAGAPGSRDERVMTHFVRAFDYAAPDLRFVLADRLSLRAQIEAESTAAVKGLKRELEAGL
jgi:uncharacterized protein YndB with AHSA1/START domain